MLNKSYFIDFVIRPVKTCQSGKDKPMEKNGLNPVYT